MNSTEALTKWEYPVSRKNKRLLKEVCEKHPELCKSLTPLLIKNGSRKPYLKDGRHKDTYTHIVHAVSSCAHLYPDSIGLDEARLIEQLDQLRKEKIIEKRNKKKKNATENYNTTLKTQGWLIERRKAHWKPYIAAAKEIKPDIVVYKQD